MGYDCTLHVVDTSRITDVFVPKLIGMIEDPSPFDARDDAQELWEQVRDAIEGKSPEARELGPRAAASMVAQLALVFSAAELPYHYERGFCLSLWTEQPEEIFATVPTKFRGNSEPLFTAVVEAHPELKGAFPQEIESNFCPGFYIPAEQVAALLKWTRGKVKRFPKPEQRLFRGLLLTLQYAADHGLAYWEGTDLPLPIATMSPPADQRRGEAEEVCYPDGFKASMWPRREFGEQIVIPGGEQTLVADCREWPPKFQLWDEYAWSAFLSRDARWLTASSSVEAEFMYRCRVGNEKTESKTVYLPDDEGRNGASWCAFWNDQIIAVFEQELPNYEKRTILHIAEGTRFKPFPGLPDALECNPTYGVVQLHNGEDVLVWRGDGHCLRNGRLEMTYPMSAIAYGKMTWSSVAFGEDEFFYVTNEEPYVYNQTNYMRLDSGYRLCSVAPGQPPTIHMPKMKDIDSISAGPDNSILIKEGIHGSGDLAKIYFPGEGTYLRIEPEIFDDEDPTDINSLFWSSATDRLIASTDKRLWAVSGESVRKLPRYRASSGRRC